MKERAGLRPARLPRPMFELHPTLAQDCIEIGTLDLCLVLLMDDRTYPWLVLVPQRRDVSEIYQLSGADRILMVEECCRTGAALQQVFRPDKINTAALGNQVAQLHIHVIARFRSDPAWPHPVWGRIPPSPYPPDERQRTIAALQRAIHGATC